MKTKVLAKGLFWTLLALLPAATIVSCKSSDDGKQKGDSAAAAPRHELAKEEGPGMDEERPASVDTLKWNGTDYVLSIHRAPTQDVPAVKDNWGDPYLDNAVDVVVKRGEETVAEHTFLKTDFASAASGIDLSTRTLGGLGYRKVDNGGYVIMTAAICEPGDSEGGDLFKVKMSLSDGSFVITRDTSVDNYVTGEVVENQE